jgi:hypothetical protein
VADLERRFATSGARRIPPASAGPHTTMDLSDLLAEKLLVFGDSENSQGYISIDASVEVPVRRKLRVVTGVA